jgi:hypothetical protein
MPATLAVRDETPIGGVSNEWSLDESFTIGPATAVTFLRLALLVGG